MLVAIRGLREDGGELVALRFQPLDRAGEPVAVCAEPFHRGCVVVRPGSLQGLFEVDHFGLRLGELDGYDVLAGVVQSVEALALATRNSRAVAHVCEKARQRVSTPDRISSFKEPFKPLAVVDLLLSEASPQNLSGDQPKLAASNRSYAAATRRSTGLLVGCCDVIDQHAQQPLALAQAAHLGLEVLELGPKAFPPTLKPLKRTLDPLIFGRRGADERGVGRGTGRHTLYP